MNGKERVSILLEGGTPDRPPLVDMIRNDPILEHFAGEPLTYDNAKRVVRTAHARALDGTRMLPKLPVPEIEDTLYDGRKAKYERWTRWVEHKTYLDLDDYVKQKKAWLEQPVLSAEEIAEARALIAEYQACQRDYLSEMAFFWGFGVHDPHQFGVGCRSLIGYYFTELYEEIGLDKFSLFFYQDMGLVSALLERMFEKSLATIELLPTAGERPLGLFIADDLAFKSGPFFSPAIFEAEYFPRLKKVCDAIHAKNMAVQFHTDGDLRMILSGLVAAGIDALNPIEKIEAMPVKWIHDRFPNLLMAGGIDISHLLPFGTPAQIKDEVRRLVDDAGGKLMVGSSSIVTTAVPLQNFLAMKEAVEEIRY